MIARYTATSSLGAFVKKRILICALAVGAFALTLALSSRHDDLRRSDAATSTRVAAQAQPPDVMATPTGEVAPAAAAMNPPPAISPPPEPEQSEPPSEPNSTPDVDDGQKEHGTLAQRDRGTERSARSR
jgi:hypothetical protein